MPISLELLTDEAIVDYSRSNGRDHILTDHRDLNLKVKTGIAPWDGGVYDTSIFGSPIADRCICGKIKKPTPEPCPNCGVRVFTREESLRRFARIELPFYYLNDLRYDMFKSFFDDVFKDSEIKLKFVNNDPKAGGYYHSGRGTKLGIKVFDTCQFEYNAKNKVLTISEFITDEKKCSYEGILKILEKHFPEKVVQYKKLINRNYLVLPAAMRPFGLVRKSSGGSASMTVHRASSWYSSIIRFCCPDAKESNKVNYDDVMKSFSTPGERVRYQAILRAYLNIGKKLATELLNSSKKNLAREAYSVRTKESARCPIVPSTDLQIDEIGIPVHIAYELCRAGFIEHLQKELNFTEEEASKATREEWQNPETQKLFKEYAEKQLVLN